LTVLQPTLLVLSCCERCSQRVVTHAENVSISGKIRILHQKWLWLAAKGSRMQGVVGQIVTAGRRLTPRILV
jgi:hypothetical protein